MVGIEGRGRLWWGLCRWGEGGESRAMAQPMGVSYEEEIDILRERLSEVLGADG